MAFDRIFSLQIETTEKADSLVLLTQLLNTNERINDLHLQEVISDKKMGLMSQLDKMPSSDARLYRMLTQQFNGFLDTKDSIRYMLQEEQLNCWVSIRYRSEEHTSELQSRPHLVCRLLLEK